MANPIKAVKAVKKITAGNKKLRIKVNNLSNATSNRTGDNVVIVYEKGKIKDYYGNFSPIKTKPRSITKKAKQMLPSDKKTSKDVNKIIKKRGNAVKPNELLFSKRSINKVPVKKRGK